MALPRASRLIFASASAEASPPLRSSTASRFLTFGASDARPAPTPIASTIRKLILIPAGNAVRVRIPCRLDSSHNPVDALNTRGSEAGPCYDQQEGRTSSGG